MKLGGRAVGVFVVGLVAAMVAASMAVLPMTAAQAARPMLFVHDDGNGPYVAWSTGLTSGSRYDVKSFTVQISYQALVPEGQKRTVAQSGCGVRENGPRCADLLPARAPGLRAP